MEFKVYKQNPIIQTNLLFMLETIYLQLILKLIRHV